MPPSTPSVTMFQRGGTYLHRRLTRLYADTKQSYASNVTPVSTAIDEDPERLALRRDFRIQQDRLLAWGYHWSDTKAAEAQQHGYGDIEIDKRLDQAGFGDLVASVMSEIQRLLDESGKLQHPERYLASKGSRLSQSPPQKKEWNEHEVTTARALLEQLTSRIDTLYGLSETRRTISQSEKWDAKLSLDEGKSTSNLRKSMDESDITFHSRKRQRVSETKPLPREPLYDDSLFIDFERLALQEDSAQNSSDPPPYEEVNTMVPEQILGNLAPSNEPVIVDFVASKEAAQYAGAHLNLERLHQHADLCSRLSRVSDLSHNSHLKLLGFTVDESERRIGFVYAMPNRTGANLRPRQRSLAAIIKTGHTSTDPSSPNLENRFRLSYNIMLSLLGYLTEGSCHAQFNSGNIIYDVGSGRANVFRDWQGLRSPTLLPSAQPALTTNMTEPHTAQIFRHPADDPKYDAEIAPSHNIYSLGLILLEIGLWMPITKLWKPKYNRMTFMTKVKTVYVRNLASKCSSKYMRAVEKCLDAPYKDLSPFSSSGTRNGRQDPVEYLLDVAKDLAQCCAIDDDGPPPASDLDHFITILADRALKDLHEGDSSVVQAPPTPNSMTNDDDTSCQQTLVESESVNQEAKQTNLILRKWPEIDISQEDLDQWNTVLMPRLSKILQNAMMNSTESCSVSLMMVGESSETARTTICIQCQDTTAVHTALQQRFKPKRGWGLVILKGDVRRSGRRRTPKRRQKQPQVPAAPTAPERLREQFYQEKPTCGASIGAFKDGEHLPPVSFGGTIMVDGRPFGMTVHHMLDDVSDDEEATETRRSAGTRDVTSLHLQTLQDDLVFMQPVDDIPSNLTALELSDDEEYDSDSDTSTIRPDYSAFDADGSEFWFLEDSPGSDPGLDDDQGSSSESSDSEKDEEDDDTASVGDRVGVDPTDEDIFHVTQPAIDDVDEDFFPSLEDRDDDHLASHSFGYLHASSGIRRVVSGDVKHEVDWALIKIQEERLHVGNAIRPDTAKGGARRRAAKTQPKKTDLEHMLTGVMASQKLAGTEVHCCGRSSGFKKGRISQAMALVKLHGRQSFSSSWCVEGGFGIPGDSGAWVYSPANRQLCGHVLAWGDKSKTAYIAPMEVLFGDIRETLGAERVCLPGDVGVGGMKMETEREKEKEKEKEAELNRQLLKSREIEVALRGMALGDDGVGVEEAIAKGNGKGQAMGLMDIQPVVVRKDGPAIGQHRAIGRSQGVVQVVL